LPEPNRLILNVGFFLIEEAANKLSVAAKTRPRQYPLYQEQVIANTYYSNDASFALDIF
jgi:hypothetical protein